MTTPTLFKEYIWLVNTIRRAERITFAEIQAKWIDAEISEGVELARSTFNRHKDAIEDIFGIYIECDRKDGYRYYIGNAEDLDEDTVQNWMLSTMTVNDIVADSKAMHDRILLQHIPCDDYLPYPKPRQSGQGAGSCKSGRENLRNLREYIKKI